MTSPFLDRYLRRIGHRGAYAADLDTLARLHGLHATAIPFENLSPLLGETVGLDTASLTAKLVDRRRGGYCFEHNLLFREVLVQAGFDVVPLAARVLWNQPAGFLPPRTHMLLRVTIDGEHHIADVGFGGITLTTPLRLVPGVEQPTTHEAFRLVSAHDGYILEVRLEDAWRSMYWFDLQRQEQPDYEMSSWYLCNHPASQFVNNLIAARPVAEGRHALRNNQYAFHDRGGDTERRTLRNADEVLALLQSTFNIELPAPTLLETRIATLLAGVGGTPA